MTKGLKYQKPHCTRTGKICNRKRASKQPLLQKEHYKFIDEAMSENDELTTYGLLIKLRDKFPTVELSLSTIHRARRYLGWISTAPKYCQLIRQVNKEKRLAWCKEMLDTDENFDDVIWTDECSFKLEFHSLRCYRKAGERKKLKPRPKHPLKVHLWGGISKHGTTPIVIFTGKLVATRLVKIFEVGLVPFVRTLPAHRFQQDNDPKHCSRLA